MKLIPGRQLRILDFDIENRPLTYYVPDHPTAEITSIAACPLGKTIPQVWLLGQHTMKEILLGFKALYDEAEMVTGHYITRHDLPIINAHLVEEGLEPLAPKLAQDTKTDLIKWKDIPKTQEHLAEMLGCPIAKVHMTQADWREANRLTPAGLAKTKKRVQTDVLQHMWIRQALLDRGMLKPPRIWRP